LVKWGKGGTKMEMELELYYAGKQWIFNDPANEGFEEALELLSRLKGKGVSVKTIDTSKFSKEELREVYFGKAYILSIRKHIGIRRVFGSRRQGSGLFFGREVPTLFVYKKGEKYPSNVYPHQKRGGGPVVTIKDFLRSLVKE